ncbi:MAG TPA: metal ABC transporter permease [Acidimicrobiales bacterium]|nr:metal ABC transporter permease [Acidimicrobiales bacterium]
MKWLFAPGLFSSGPVLQAAVVGVVVAVACAPVGVFTVARGQSFAGHAFADIASTGGSAAALFGFSPLLGFLGMALAGASATEALSAPGAHARDRDLVTGTVFGAALGLSALLLYLQSTEQSTGGTVVSVLFGSLFVVGPETWPLVVPAATLALVASAVLYRPLLLATISSELAVARRVRLRWMSAAHSAVLATCVALSAVTIGAVLSTALLVGPAAVGSRLGRTPPQAIAWAAATGAGCTLAGIWLAYDSYEWPPRGQGWPVSFFVVTLVVAAYGASRMYRPKLRAPRLGGHPLEDRG